MDEETGLYYYGARYLDPKYSRWLSGDPALSEQPVVLWICNSGQDPQNINNSQDCYTKKFTDALGQGVIVIASTGFVNYKSGLAMISNKSGSRQNTIPYISVNTGEQYKFVGENNNGKSMFLFLFIKYVFIIL